MNFELWFWLCYVLSLFFAATRLVKYMGLGNAAGLLVAKGVFKADVALGSLEQSGKYSKDGDCYEESDNESDTEEYKELRTK